MSSGSWGRSKSSTTRDLALGGPKQRALLAALLLHRGEVISSERLIDELWGGRPPATAVKTLRVYVSNLRKALGDGFLVTRGHGYLLTPKPDQVDVDRFERLAAEGRAALERGTRWLHVSGSGRRWLCGVGRRWLISRMSHSRGRRSRALSRHAFLALEDRIDADLALGSDGALIAELEGLVAADPRCRSGCVGS